MRIKREIGKIDRSKLQATSFKIVDEANSLTLIVRRNHWDNEEKYKEETTNPNQMVVMLPMYEYDRIKKHMEHLTGGQKSGKQVVKYLSPKQSSKAITDLVQGLLSWLPLKTV